MRSWDDPRCRWSLNNGLLLSALLSIFSFLLLSFLETNRSSRPPHLRLCQSFLHPSGPPPTSDQRSVALMARNVKKFSTVIVRYFDTIVEWLRCNNISIPTFDRAFRSMHDKTVTTCNFSHLTISEDNCSCNTSGNHHARNTAYTVSWSL